MMHDISAVIGIGFDIGRYFHLYHATQADKRVLPWYN